MYDVLIIGGGASSCMAATYIKMNNSNIKIAIIEKNQELMKKLAATGNGKCNISNDDCSDWEYTAEIFNKIGVFTKTDTEGRIYPISESAKDVVYRLKQYLISNNVDIFLSEEVKEIKKDKENFTIKTDKKQYEGKNIILAMGGKAAPQFGTVGDGYALAKDLGHSITKLAPILTGIKTKDTKGIVNVRSKALVKLFCKNDLISIESGEIQFTKEGISGICIFNLSRYLLLDKETKFKDYEISVDFVPSIEVEILQQMIEINRANNEERLLCTIVNEKIEREILKDTNNSKKIAKKLKDFRISVDGAMGWDKAQCTKGGISINEMDNNYKSKKVEGLYIIGEMLDLDGPCGGYNLQIAWTSAIKAGREICIEYTK